MCIFSQTLVRGSRSTLQSLQAVYRTTSVEARGIRKARREDRHMAPNGSRERSCDTRRQRTVMQSVRTRARWPSESSAPEAAALSNDR